MFETNDQGKLHDSPFFPPQPGSHRWAYVAQTSKNEWFFVTYEALQDDALWSQQLLIPGPEYLLGLATRGSAAEAIKEVQLVSPPWLNDSGRWLMEPLKEIRVCGKRFCYRLQDGGFYPQELLGETSKVMWLAPEGNE